MNERQQKIQNILNEKGEVKLPELELIFPDISSMTLRRDLEKLEALGEVVRIRNGAKSITHLSALKEDLFSKRANENITEKKLIAEKACTLIIQGCSVFLDSGTTAVNLARMLPDYKLNVITAAPNVALECAKKSDISVFMTGGQLSTDNLSLSGVNANDFLDNINIDIAFMAASGFSFKNFFTCGNFDECRLKKRVIERATKVVMLMDSSKCGKSLPFTFALPDDIDVFVSDDKLDSEFSEAINKYGVEVF